MTADPNQIQTETGVTRHYWVVNSHGSYTESNPKWKWPWNPPNNGYFYCAKTKTLLINHKTIPQFTVLIPKTGEKVWDSTMKTIAGEERTITKGNELEDYFVEHCDECGSKSGIFYVTVRNDKIHNVWKWDLSKIPDGTALYFQDFLKHELHDGHTFVAPVFWLICRKPSTDSPKRLNPETLIMDPAYNSAKTEDYSDWIEIFNDNDNVQIDTDHYANSDLLRNYHYNNEYAQIDTDHYANSDLLGRNYHYNEYVQMDTDHYANISLIISIIMITCAIFTLTFFCGIITGYTGNLIISKSKKRIVQNESV
eukprot:99918_1